MYVSTRPRASARVVTNLNDPTKPYVAARGSYLTSAGVEGRAVELEIYLASVPCARGGDVGMQRGMSENVTARLGVLQET